LGQERTLHLGHSLDHWLHRVTLLQPVLCPPRLVPRTLEWDVRSESQVVGALSTGAGAALTEQLSTPPCGKPAHSMRLLICTG
jgi:hypothetical protein